MADQGNFRSVFRQGIQETSRGVALAAGATAVGTLIAGGLWPVLGAYVAGNLTFSLVENFLGSLGGNAVASWLSDLGKGGIRKYLDGSKAEFAEEINKQLEHNKKFFESVLNIFDEINITNVSLKLIETQSFQQASLIMKLSDDLDRYSKRHNVIHISLFENISDTLQRISKEDREFISQGNTKIINHIEQLNQKFDKYIEEGIRVAMQNNFNGNIQTVYIADQITINNPPPNPDEPIDILEALFPQRGKIV